MEKCPVCKKHTVVFDSYKGVKKCSVDGCTYEKAGQLESILTTRRGRHVRIPLDQKNSSNPTILRDCGAVMMK